MISAHKSAAEIVFFDEVSRVYGRGLPETRALGPISFSVRHGEFVAIMGPSGSGKSTLLSLAGALDAPTQGRVLLEGCDLAAMPPRELAGLRRRRIGFVFQDLNLLPGLTALENVSLPLELDGVRLREARGEALAELSRVGLQSLCERFPDNMSGGEQQRVAIARSFVGGRQLLLADEPTGALDSLTGEHVMQLLRAQCDHGRTVMLVTHNASHAAWADRVLFLRDGRIVDEETVTELPQANEKSNGGDA